MSNNPLLGVFAPYPKKEYLTDGWYRRIYLIDQIFSGIPRVYLNTLHIAPNNPIVTHPNGTREVFLSPRSKKISGEVYEILNRIKLNYIHTTHLGEDFLELNFSGDFVVDFHGAAPEEEALQGNVGNFHSLSDVEKILYSQAKSHIFVSVGMAKHFEIKYKESVSQFTLPIISEVRLKSLELQQGATQEFRDTYVYAGGIQPWQNIPEMLEVAARKKKRLNIATNQLMEFNALYPQKRYPFCSVQQYNKKELLELYSASTFGYVLREDNIVNQVAFPTKLFEYIACGVIPIMKYRGLGGLDHYGLFSIGIDDQSEIDFGLDDLAEHRTKNHNISLKVIADFLENANKLREAILIKLKV